MASDGAQLWEALRALSDAEREAAVQTLARFRSLRGDGAALSVRVGGREWPCATLADTLLAHLRALAHEQSRADDEAREATPEFSLQREDFPTLAASPAATATRPAAKVTKRRITTTLVSTDAPYAAVAAKQPPPVPSDNANVWPKRNLLEKRMGPSPSKPSADRRAVLLMGGIPSPASEPFKSSNQWMSPPPPTTGLERKPPPISLQAKHKTKRVALAEKPTLLAQDPKTTPERLQVVQANTQAARIYGNLIVQRLVPSICIEIQFLIGLLHRSNCNACAHKDTSTAPNEFCNSVSSTAFAVVAIETLAPTLVHLGTDMLQLLAKCLEDLSLCENLVSRLRNAIESREERRVRESSRIGCELPIETKVAVFRDYALPFCEDMDSRLNYRSPTESVIYSNREKIRDAFLGQLRAFQKKQNSLLGKDADGSDVGASLQDVRQLLKEVMSENLWWFARFFVLELVQIGSNPLGESDKDLVMKIMEDKMVVKNPDRLRKLHRRFTSKKIPDSTTGGLSTTGFHQQHRSKSNHHHPNRKHVEDNASSHELTIKSRPIEPNKYPVALDRKSSTATETASDGSRSLEQMRGFFSDNQAFFFHFLVSCDSFQFAQLVHHQLNAQFLTIWRTTPEADPRKEFTEVVLRLKVLAKFIGFLRFSPQWHWSALTTALTPKNPALEAAQREAISTMDKSHSANGFDALSFLEESIIGNKVAKCIPWLCDYLSMLSSDILSSSTRYFQRLLQLLACVHRSCSLDCLGETGLYVAMQIEHLFQLLGIDDVVSPTLRWQRIEHNPPAWLRKDVLNALLVERVSPALDKTDTLPFLYSNLFVQVCINELEDLRGFIQTRANPHHKKPSNRRASVFGVGAPAIRKVRPLQVMSEGYLEASSITVVQSGSEDGRSKNQLKESDGDPLREAFFKLYPQLKRAVEFVVDMVVTNICEHTINKYVKPNVDDLIDSCVREAKANAPEFTHLILHGFQVRLDERLEDFMTTTVSKALKEAKTLCSERVECSLKPLIAPSIPRQLASAALMMAKAQAKAAITKLITRSLRTEFLKRVAQRKRAIVKEAGVAAGADKSSSNSDDSDNQASITRALKFSFDDNSDANQTPLDEAFQGIKINVCGMSGVAHNNGRPLASFVRFQRGFCKVLDDAAEELRAMDEHSKTEAAVRLCSWVWRAVRLSLKMFARVIAGVQNDQSSSKESDERHTQDFVSAFAKTLRVIAKLNFDAKADPRRHAVERLGVFVAQCAVTIPAMDEMVTDHNPCEPCKLPFFVITACAEIYAAAFAMGKVCPSSLGANHVAQAIVTHATLLPSQTV